MQAQHFLQRLGSHVRWKSVTELLSRAISLIFIFVCARTLGDAGYGAFSLPLAWAGLWAMTLDWGTQHLLIRELGEQKSPWRLLPQAFYLKVFASVFFALGLWLSHRWAPHIPVHALWAAGLWSIAQSWNDTLFALLNAYERFREEALYRNAMRFLLLLPQLLILALIPEVWTLLWVSALSQCALTLLLYGYFLYQLKPQIMAHTHKGDLRPQRTALWQLWRKGLSFWWFHVAWLIYLKLDLVMLPNFLKGVENPLQHLGWYQGAIRCYEIVALIGYILSMSLYPLWVRLPAAQRQMFWRKLNLYLWPGTLCVAAIAYGLAPWGLPLLLGPEFSPAIALFQVLSFSLPCVIFNQIALNVLAAQHRQQWTAWAATGGLLLNASLNAYGIPRYGASAAAWSTVIADVFLTLCFLGLSLRSPSLSSPSPDTRTAP